MTKFVSMVTMIMVLFMAVIKAQPAPVDVVPVNNAIENIADNEKDLINEPTTQAVNQNSNDLGMILSFYLIAIN